MKIINTVFVCIIAALFTFVLDIKIQKYRAERDGLNICNSKGFQAVTLEYKGRKGLDIEYDYQCSEPIPNQLPKKRLL